jgi:glycosyltransferase involved in cell wall biosynthesis
VRILAITDYYRERVENGSEVFCARLIDALRRDHRIDVLARAAEEAGAGRSRARWSVDDGTANDLISLGRFLLANIDPAEYDCVYNLGALMFGCRVVRVARALFGDLPLVNHFQALLGPYAAMEGRPAEVREAHAVDQRLAAAGARLNVFISRDELHAASESGMEPARNPAAVVPNGLPFDEYDRIQADRSYLGPGGASRFAIVSGGRFSDAVKGADLLYRAFAQFASENPDAFLLVASNSDRFTHILQDVPAERWRMERWLPRRRFLEMLAGADLAVAPSRYEPFGLIAVEAMSLGVPVLGNAVGGLADMIRPGEFGMLNPLQDGSFGLLSAMRALSSDRAGLKAMGQAARSFVRKEYDIARIAARASALLQNACMAVV